MEISVKTFVLFGALILTGLSAGLFYAWSVSVIPGTQKVSDLTYLETMQSINRAILNPNFFAVFFGSIIFLFVSTVYELNHNKLSFWLIFIATMFYLIGTVGVTGIGNVPLNNQLDALNINELSSNKITEFRVFYEEKWNRFHLIRTLCAVAAFVFAVLSIFSKMITFK